MVRLHKNNNAGNPHKHYIFGRTSLFRLRSHKNNLQSKTIGQAVSNKKSYRISGVSTPPTGRTGTPLFHARKEGGTVGMFFTENKKRAFELLMRQKPGFERFQSGCAGDDEDCNACRFYRPNWKYDFCVFKECPYCPGKRTRKTPPNVEC